jgi:hypothetical protein
VPEASRTVAGAAAAIVTFFRSDASSTRTVGAGPFASVVPW